ncbi:MAG TPA: c-type cytochrome biogenesis protein CcsB [Deltaproteobacteria bacterium]|nr:c-type cytochrome biogenesis protein CcsB [Deltaproteobacteria bacterium]
MTSIWFNIALFFELLATGGFIIYIIKQEKWVFRCSYWILTAGLVFHTIFLVYRYSILGVFPVLDLKSAFSFFAWAVIVVYLLLNVKFQLMVLGSFVAPFAAFLMLISYTIPGMEGPVKPIFKSLWLSIHVSTIFIGNAFLAIAFLASIMYLIQERHIKKKHFGSFYSRLPSLATLDRINHYAILYGFPFLTAGMITGSIYAQYALGRYWQWDPKEVWSLISWLLYAALLHERLAAGWQGRKAAVMSIACFLVLVFTFLGANLLVGGYHSFSALGAR